MSKKEAGREKPRVKSDKLRVKVWPVLEEAVESGLALGWTRAHKHTDTPGDDAIRQQQLDTIMESISEKFYIEEKD